MAKVESGYDLLEELARLLDGQPRLLDQVVEQLAARHVLEHQIQVLLVLVHVVEAQHVRMLDQLHYGDLALHLSSISTNAHIISHRLSKTTTPTTTTTTTKDKKCNSNMQVARSCLLCSSAAVSH